jgi:hypothetical protein
VNTIQIPDTLPNALILSGAPSNGVFMGFLGRSANSEYLTLGGYNVSQPNTTHPSGIASGSGRAIGVVGANGYFALAQLDSGFFTASTPGFNSVASTDGLLNFWLTGIAASDGLKYDHVAINAAPTSILPRRPRPVMSRKLTRLEMWLLPPPTALVTRD